MATAANDNFATSIQSSSKASAEAGRGFFATAESILSLTGHLKLLAVAAYAVSPAFRSFVNAGIAKLLTDIIPVGALATKALTTVGAALSPLLTLFMRLGPPILTAVVAIKAFNAVFDHGSALLDKYANSLRSLYSDDVVQNLQKLTKNQGEAGEIISAEQIARATELGVRLQDAGFIINKFLTTSIIDLTNASLSLQRVWVNFVELVAKGAQIIQGLPIKQLLQAAATTAVGGAVVGGVKLASNVFGTSEEENRASNVQSATDRLSAVMGVAALATEALNKTKMAAGELDRELDIGSSFIARYSDNIRKLAEGMKEADTWDRVAKSIERHTRSMEANSASLEKDIGFQEQLRVETQLLTSTRGGLNAATDDQIDKFVELRTKGVEPLNAAMEAGIKFDRDRAKSFEEMSKAAGEARLSLAQANAALAQTKALEADQIALKGLTAFSPSQKGEVAALQKQLELRDQVRKEGLSQEQADERAASARKLAYQTEVVQLSEIARARQLSAQQTVDQAKLEVELIGKNIGLQTELRANLAARQQLEQEASQKRTAFDEAQFDRLKKINAELGKQTQLNALNAVNENNRFDRNTSLLTQEDVAIAQQLRTIYPDVATALGSIQAQAMQTNKAMSSLSSTVSTSLTTGLADIADGTKSVSQGFSDMSKVIARAVEEMVIKLYVVIPLMRTLQSLVSSLGFGGGVSPAEAVGNGTAPVMHTGGIVGQEPTAMRNVDSNVFQFAPRFHRGLMPDEFPAILQRGEGVFTKGQMAAMGGNRSPNITVNLIEDSTRAGQTESKQNANGGTDLTVFVDAITAKNANNPGSATSAALDTRKRVATR
jgi:hypothetical protein